MEAMADNAKLASVIRKNQDQDSYSDGFLSDGSIVSSNYEPSGDTSKSMADSSFLKSNSSLHVSDDKSYVDDKA